MLRLLSVGFVFRGIAVVADALLRRHLDFRRQVLIESASYVIGYGVVAVALASVQYGVWSLVWGGLVQIAIASIARLATVRHTIVPQLAWRRLADLLGFGFGTAASACVNYLALNGDYFVVGQLMGTFNLGLYTRAYGLMNLPQAHAAGLMSGVMFPAFAEAQGNRSRVRAGFLAEAKRRPETVYVLDAMPSVEEVHRQICRLVVERFGA